MDLFRGALKITDKITDHLTIDSFGWALVGALLMAMIGTLGQWLIYRPY